MASRVLVSEPLAERGLDAMRAAGLDVDLQAGPGARASCSTRSRARHALVIRSATQVTAEVLAAGRRPRRGRPGRYRPRQRRRRGSDPARRHGRERAAVEHPLGRRAHARAAARRRRATCRRRTPTCKAGQWNRSKWEGVELHGKTLGIVGLGRVGVLVAQRAHAFGMRLVAYDPFVSAERARQLGVQLVPTIEELVAICDFVSIHATKTPETIGLVNADVLAHAKPGMRLINAGRGGIVDEDALADGDRATAGWAAPPSTRSRRSRPPSRRCSRSTTSSSRRTSARRPSRRRTRRGRRSPSRSCSRCAATSCRSPSTSRRRRRPRACGRSCRSPNASAGCSPASPAARRATLEIDVRRRDRRLRLPRAHAVGAEGRARRRSSTSRCRS